MLVRCYLLYCCMVKKLMQLQQVITILQIYLLIIKLILEMQQQELEEHKFTNYYAFGQQGILFFYYSIQYKSSL